jgi:2-C-methyl-D-erythritol 2,4-cyclodiphosphate synthase
MASRVGLGYDAHRFASGRRLVLCGVEIPHEVGLAGHSDADVAAHAVMDALLGAAGLGDIGELYPDDDPRFENASSIELLGEVRRRLHAANWMVDSIDVVLVLERPHLAPYRRVMRKSLAAVLELRVGAVSVKATTTEGMGFEGRGEGVSALAVCLAHRTKDAAAD